MVNTPCVTTADIMYLEEHPSANMIQKYRSVF